MRSESEITAMRDQLERYALSPDGVTAEQRAALNALRWATDPSLNDLDVLDHPGMPPLGYQY